MPIIFITSPGMIPNHRPFCYKYFLTSHMCTCAWFVVTFKPTEYKTNSSRFRGQGLFGLLLNALCKSLYFKCKQSLL